MRNFLFIHEGKELWYSRALACNLVVIRVKKCLFHKEVHVLANRRGPGCEFNKGLWNVPGGFIDFDEDSIECAIREAKEECGVDIPREKVQFVDLNTIPRGFRQTMVATHVAIVSSKDYPGEYIKYTDTKLNESDMVKWISVKELDEYSWVPGQLRMIKSVLKKVSLN